MSNNIRQRIGAELRALREAKGLTTRELAERCGLIHSHIVRIESGRYGFTIDTLNTVCTALGAEIDITSQFMTGIMKTEIKNILEKYGEYSISPLGGLKIAEATLHIFDFDGEASGTAAAITYDDSDVVFTNTDWHGWCPRSEEDIPECDWCAIDEDGHIHHAIILNNLPRIL